MAHDDVNAESVAVHALNIIIEILETCVEDSEANTYRLWFLSVADQNASQRTMMHRKYGKL